MVDARASFTRVARDGDVVSEDRPGSAPIGSDAERTLMVIRSLLDQLGLRPSRQLGLDSDLTAALGVDSLALIELFDELELEFDVTLSQEIFLTATTPRHWLDAVRAARGERVDREPAAATVTLRRNGGEAWPDHAETLIEALAWHVDAHPDQVCLRLLGANPLDPAEDVSYGALERESRVIASGLLASGLRRGDRVGIMLATSRDYFVVFLGVHLAGGVPVPIYPPAQMAVLEAHLTRQSRLLDNAGAAMLVTLPEAMVAARLVRSRVPTLRAVRTTESLRDAGRVPLPLPEVHGDDVALIQYTSGSTGDPKGVVLTNRQLIANVQSMGDAVRIDTSDVVVTWLPLYHDMGLIGCWHTPLYFGVPVVVMSPLTFLAHPATWLTAISSQSGTLSVGPNFAYQNCVDRVNDAELEGLDLSSWRVAINGSEPVSASTIDDFVARFGSRGFERTSMCPAYGLAEMGVGVAFTAVGAGPRVDVIERATLQESARAVSAASGGGATSVVSCGRALSGYEVRVVGPEGDELAERFEGAVECRGPSATVGYYKNDDANRALWHGAWLDTGDLGYVAEGDLFLTGRSKDVIIRGGRKLHPEELERRLGALPGIEPGGVAVFAGADERRGTEEIVVVVETDVSVADARLVLEDEIARDARDLLGATPDRIVLTSRGALPRTASGKLRRGAARDMLAAGELGRAPPPVPLQLARFAWSGWAQRIARSPRELVELPYRVYALSVVTGLALCAGVVLALPVTLERRSAFARVIGRVAGRLLGITVEVDGALEDVAPPVVIVANHSSFVDGIFLWVLFDEPVAFVTSTEQGRNPILGPALRRLGCVFVDRGQPGRVADSVAQLVTASRAGRRVVVFPEGSISGMEELRPFRLGAFETATTLGCPIVPVGIRGSRAVLAPGTSRVHAGHIRVAVGEPIVPRGTDFAARVWLRDAAREAVARLSRDDGKAEPTPPVTR